MQKVYSIQVAGKPQGKDRPRFNFRTKRAYTTKNTENYELAISNRWKAVYGEEKLDGYIYLSVDAYYPLNKGDSLKQKERKLSGELRPDKKPDADNILKVVADALNGVAYDDDKQIITMHCSKFYSMHPRIVIMMTRED